MPPGQKGFQKGVSGNPGGRSRASAVVSRMLRAKTHDGLDLAQFALDVWQGVLKDANGKPTMDSEKCRQWAHDWISDRILGKAPAVPIDDEVERPIDLSQMTESQLEALAELDAQNPSPEAKVLRLVPSPDDEPGGAA